MRPLFLELDEALGGQPGLLEPGLTAGGRRLDARRLGPGLRLWSRPKALSALVDHLRDWAPAEGPELVFAGSGDFHHVTPLLIERALQASGAPVATVVHFDNHPDWVRFDNGMHCGSWVGRAARLPGVSRLITVGVCSGDIHRPAGKGGDLSLVEEDRVELYAYREPTGQDAVRLCGREWPTIEAVGERAFADLLASRIQTEAVYVTIDKDVLRTDDAVTNWDQGRTSFALLRDLVQTIAARHRLIGADVVGDWSRPAYGGGLVAALLKQGEALLDQPWRQPSPARARTVNEPVNLQLLQLFNEAAR